jgi:hypothetical protein
MTLIGVQALWTPEVLVEIEDPRASALVFVTSRRMLVASLPVGASRPMCSGDDLEAWLGVTLHSWADRYGVWSRGWSPAGGAGGTCQPTGWMVARRS